jgi:DNA-binding beta-propeller fold protein YncE
MPRQAPLFGTLKSTALPLTTVIFFFPESRFDEPASRLGKAKTPDRISVYSPAGKLLRKWGRSGKGDGELNWPGGIAVSATGRVYVADQTNHRVQVFDSSGKFPTKWGEYGTKPGQFGGNSNPLSRVGGPHEVL